jgi:hypothetical protein
VSDLYELIESPELDSPTLLLGLDGWIDAGLAATNAFGTLLEKSRNSDGGAIQR